MSFDKHNKRTMKEQIDNVVNSLDRSQLAAANNRIDMEREAQDIALENFVKSRGTNLTLNEPFVKHNAAPLVEPEMSRFNIDHTETARKLTKRID